MRIRWFMVTLGCMPFVLQNAPECMGINEWGINNMGLAGTEECAVSSITASTKVMMHWQSAHSWLCSVLFSFLISSGQAAAMSVVDTLQRDGGTVRLATMQTLCQKPHPRHWQLPGRAARCKLVVCSTSLLSPFGKGHILLIRNQGVEQCQHGARWNKLIATLVPCLMAAVSPKPASNGCHAAHASHHQC